MFRALGGRLQARGTTLLSVRQCSPMTPLAFFHRRALSSKPSEDRAFPDRTTPSSGDPNPPKQGIRHLLKVYGRPAFVVYCGVGTTMLAASYTAVRSGLDAAAILAWFGLSVPPAAGQLLVAYAICKARACSSATVLFSLMLFILFSHSHPFTRLPFHCWLSTPSLHLTSQALFPIHVALTAAIVPAAAPRLRRMFPKWMP
jgi:hypothetical protein